MPFRVRDALAEPGVDRGVVPGTVPTVNEHLHEEGELALGPTIRKTRIVRARAHAPWGGTSSTTVSTPFWQWGIGCIRSAASSSAGGRGAAAGTPVKGFALGRPAAEEPAR
jgi:hypothetical protein